MNGAIAVAAALLLASCGQNATSGEASRGETPGQDRAATYQDPDVGAQDGDAQVAKAEPQSAVPATSGQAHLEAGNAVPRDEAGAGTPPAAKGGY